MVMLSAKSPWIPRHFPFSRLKTITADIPSPCGYHAENRSYKMSSKVTKTFVCQGYTVPITEQFNCLPVSPSQWIGLTKPFFQATFLRSISLNVHMLAAISLWDQWKLTQYVYSNFWGTSTLLEYLKLMSLYTFATIREKYSFFRIFF